MKSLRDTKEWQIGRTGEQDIAEKLKLRGCSIIPSYDYSGEDGNKAPKLQGLNADLVIPDLDVAKDGHRVWVEVKTKTAATLTRRLGRLEHGIPLRHFKEYQIVQRVTGNKVYLAIRELDTGAILIKSIDHLETVKRIYDGGKMGYGAMVFFPRDAFRIWMPGTCT